MISLWSGEFASFLLGLHHQPPGSHVLAFVIFPFILLEQKHQCFWKRQISRLLDYLRIFTLCTHYNLRWMIWLYVKFWTWNHFPSEYWRLCTIVFCLPVLQMRNLMDSWFPVLCILFCFFFGKFGDFYPGSCNFVILDLDVEFLIYLNTWRSLAIWKLMSFSSGKNFSSFISLNFSSILFLSGTSIFPIKDYYLFVLWTPFSIKFLNT